MSPIEGWACLVIAGLLMGAGFTIVVLLHALAAMACAGIAFALLGHEPFWAAVKLLGALMLLASAFPVGALLRGAFDGSLSRR